jgi:type I restriction enzyme S subunit
MKLKKYKLGELIELVEETNSQGKYGPKDVRGMTITKEIIPTKADVANTDLRKFLVVHPDEFVFNPRTHGKKIGFGYNNTNECFLISWNNIAFRVKYDALDIVIPTYLFLHFNRKEWDREACFCSWGSSTEVFSWEALSGMHLTLPSIEQQHKYVDVYLALQNNLAVYQSKVEELKLVCDGYIEELRRKMKCERIGTYIVESNVKNSDNKIKEVRSVSVTKEFKLTNAKVNKNKLSNYLVVRPKEIAFVQTTGNEKVLAFAYNDYDYPVVVSYVDKVFGSKDENVLDLQYLSLFLSRKEFDRYARFNSWGSAREVFTMDDMNDVEIPIPDIKVQRQIVNIHKCYIERQRIAEALKEQLKNICPVLIRGSLTE